MWPFRKKAKKKTIQNSNPLLCAEELKEAFARVDLSSMAKMKHLLGNCQTLQCQITNKFYELAEAGKRYESRMAEIDEEIKNAREKIRVWASWVEAFNERKKEADKKGLLESVGEVRRFQFKEKSLNREKLDCELTLSTIQNLRRDMEEAFNIITYMVDTLERNIERLKLASFDFSQKPERIEKLEIEVDISSALEAEEKSKELSVKLAGLQTKLNKIARETKRNPRVWLIKPDPENPLEPKYIWTMELRQYDDEKSSLFFVRKMFGSAYKKDTDGYSATWTKEYCLTELLDEGYISILKLALEKLPEMFEKLEKMSETRIGQLDDLAERLVELI